MEEIELKTSLGCEPGLDAGLSSTCRCGFHSLSGSELVPGEPLGCPSVRPMLGSDLVGFYATPGQRYLIAGGGHSSSWPPELVVSDFWDVREVWGSCRCPLALTD